MASPNKVIIDTDMGVDDAMAILMILEDHQKNLLEVIAITTVFGNTTLDNANKNILRLLNMANMLHIPVYPGEEGNLTDHPLHYKPPPWHGVDGFGDVSHTLELPSMSYLQKTNATECILKAVTNKQHNEKLFFIAIGPLTNIARAIRLNSDVTMGFDGFYVMGGSVEGLSNMDYYEAEFNFCIDAQAALETLQHTKIPIKLTPMEAGKNKSLMPYKYRKELGNSTTRTANFINTIEEPITKRALANGYKDYISYDQLAAFWFLDDLNNLESGDSKFVQSVTYLKGVVSAKNDKSKGKILVANSSESKANLVVMNCINSQLYFQRLKQLFEFTFN